MNTVSSTDIKNSIVEIREAQQRLNIFLGRHKVYGVLSACGFDEWLLVCAKRTDIVPEKEYTLFDILDLIANISFGVIHQDSYVVSLVLLELCKSCPALSQYSYLENVVANYAFDSYRIGLLEKPLQNLFRENVSMFIPGASLVDVKCIEGHIPDAFVEVEGRIRPVEIKRDVITNAAVRQALRYRSAYKADKVYVMAPKCEAKIPDSLEYRQLSFPHSSISKSNAMSRLKRYVSTL